MDEEKRYYVADNGCSIIEYPAKIIHEKDRTLFDGQANGQGSVWVSVNVMPEHEVAHDRTMFRLHESIAKAAIESWEVFREEEPHLLSE